MNQMVSFTVSFGKNISTTPWLQFWKTIFQPHPGCIVSDHRAGVSGPRGLAALRGLWPERGPVPQEVLSALPRAAADAGRPLLTAGARQTVS